MGKKTKVLATIKPYAFEKHFHNEGIKKFIDEPLEMVLTNTSNERRVVLCLDNPELEKYTTDFTKANNFVIFFERQLNIIMEIPYDSSNS